MRIKCNLLVVVLIVAVLLSSASWALTPLGPPRAGLKHKQHSLGFLFSSSEMDLDVSGYGLTEELSDTESTVYLMKAAYGLSDGCELYSLVGLADLSSEDFNGSSELAWGFGAKFTVAENDSVTWGGIFQMVHLNSEGDVYGYVPGYGWVEAGVEAEVFDIQIAFGPTYTQEAFSIYGGPFLHFVDGDLEIDVLGESVTLDLEQQSEFGGYVGAQFELSESSSLFIEYQMTGDASAIAGGIGWRF